MVYLLLADGFEETEALVTVDMLRRAGVEVETLGVDALAVTGAHGIEVRADRLLADAGTEIEMVVLPGGRGVGRLREHEGVHALVRAAYERGAYVAAICAAPSVLALLGLLEGRRAVVFPGMEDEMVGALVQDAGVAEDGPFLTGQAAGSVFEFSFKLVEALRGPEAARALKESIHYRH